MIAGSNTVIQAIYLTIVAAFSLLFLLGVFLVAAPFLEGFVWATILVLMTLPIYRWLHSRCHMSEPAAAFLMCAGVGIIVMLIAVPVVMELGKEVYAITKELKLSSEIGTEHGVFKTALNQIIHSLHLEEAITLTIKTIGEISIKATGEATQLLLASLFNIGVMIFSSYFFYLHGNSLLRELKNILIRYSSMNWQRFFTLTVDTIKGVVYGAFATALAQGILAGFGYYAAGAPLPALLGLVTVFMSFIPFGAPIIYLPVSLYLILVAGDWQSGTGLLLWCIFVVSTIDNILRPLFISQKMKLPLLLVFIGVLGGILAFGLVGLFIGPVLVALVHSIWKEISISSNEALS